MNPSSSPVIDVVLASYNGVSYLSKQVESIFNQTLFPRSLIIRDDGSTDGTVELIGTLLHQYGDWLRVIPSDKCLGCNKNFEALLRYTNADYIALSDQDDVWIPDKLMISMMRIRDLEAIYGSDRPLAMFSDLVLVNQDGRLISPSFLSYQCLNPFKTSIDDLSLQNVATGCTMLFNRALIKTALPFPDEIIQHDWWLALVASRLGAITFEPQPLVMYRQHSNNIIGAKGIGFNYIVDRLFKFTFQALKGKSELEGLYWQSHSLSKKYSVNPSSLVKFADSNPKQRLWLIFSGKLRKHGYLRQIFFIMLMIPRILIGFPKHFRDKL